MKDMIATAAAWWADFLRGPRNFDAGMSREPGNRGGVFGEMLANAHQETVTSEQADAFEVAVDTAIRHEIGKHPDALERGLWLQVDYHPCPLLEAALGKAGLDTRSMTLLPWKTNMMLYTNRAKTRCGYGSEMVMIAVKVREVEVGDGEEL